MVTGTWPNSVYIDNDQIFNIYLQHINNNVIFIKKLYYKVHLHINKYINILENNYKLTMKICIIYFNYILLWKFVAHYFFPNFCVKYYWWYLDAIFTILERIQFSTKQDTQHIYIGPLLFS